MNRFENVKLASVFGIAGNVFLLIIKGTIGFITNSQAMIADTLNSAGDVLSSTITFLGNKVSSKPNDDDHNLGHGKAEYIYSMLISLIIGVMALKIFKDSLSSIFYRNTYEFSIWLVIVCIVTILVKFTLYIYTNRMSKKMNNILLKANSKDHRNDCVITTFNLISCGLNYFGIYVVDGIVGIVIAVWILISAIRLFKDSYDVLMDRAINEDAKNKVLNIIDKYEEIKKISHFNSTPVGYKYQISLSIFVDGNLSTFESHNIADKLEKEIVNNVEEIYLAVIHVNPI